MNRAAVIATLLVTAVLALLLAHGLSLGECTQDDSFITFRYATHLVEGHGLVFNPGWERVEGYTNFLWTVLLAGFIAAGLDPVPVSWLLGVLSGIGIIGLTGWFSARRIGRGGWEAVPALFFFAASSGFVGEAVQGLETLLYTLLVLAGAFHLPAARRGGRAGWLAAVWFALAAMTRPEGAMAAGLGFWYLWIGGRRDGRTWAEAGRTAVGWGMLFALLFVPYLLWRHGYYGYWVPNTFYAKTGGGLSQAARGAWYSFDFVRAGLPLLVLAVIALWPGRERRLGWAAFPLTLIVAYTLYVILVGGDFKPTFRFFMPVYPFLVLLAQEGMYRGLGRVRRQAARAAAIAAVVAIGCGWLYLFSFGSRAYSHVLRESLVDKKAIAHHLRSVTDADDVLAIGTVGIVPYYSKLPTIDMWGLNDLHIAHRDSPWSGQGSAGHEKGDGRYVFERRPDIIVFRSLARTSQPFPVDQLPALWSDLFLSERELQQIPEFLQRYELRSEFLVGFYFNYFRLREEGE